MNRPLSLQQANSICNTYQFLEGAPYDKDFQGTTPVLAVLTVPFEEQAQQNFIDDFDLLGYVDLKPYDESKGFDVIVLARYEPDREICVWMDLRSFVKRNIQQVVNYHKNFINTNSGEGIAV
jgi:hypothetical protein